MRSRPLLALASGVSARTIGSIEADGYLPSGVVQTDIERALHWPLGTLQAVAGGAEPPDTFPVSATPEVTLPGLVRELGALSERLEGLQKQGALIGQQLEAVHAKIEMLVERLSGEE